jgi:anti-sigma factor RsiW
MSLALLAVEALEEGQARELRAHLDVCPGCRGYLEEIDRVANQLRGAEVTTETEPPPFFHRRLQHSLLLERRPRPAFGWRLALPAIALALVLFLASRPSHLAPSSPPRPALAANEFAMTILRYQTEAGHSLEKLDSVLTEQGNRSVAAGPIYLAGSFTAD